MSWAERVINIVTFHQLFRSDRAETATIGSLPVSGIEVYLRYNGRYYRKISDSRHERVDLDGFVLYQSEAFNPNEFVIRGRLQILGRAA
jgi:hypothetical protein